MNYHTFPCVKGVEVTYQLKKICLSLVQILDFSGGKGFKALRFAAESGFMEAANT